MKRIFCLILVFAAVFMLASCSKKKSHDYEERISKKISAEEGGTVESSDGKTSVDIPAGALDDDTTITMTIYDASGYSDENGKIVSKVVDFGPDGTIFKKPIVITIAAEEAFENKTVVAAVYHDAEGKWSYSKDSEYAVLGKDAAGDPIMTTAAGDPIMLSAAGDPIMQNAAGDPIMMASAGDPIMTSAAGDPIMNAAAGDPIMMGAGHFTSYTFIILNREKPGEPDADVPEEDIDENDDDEPADDTDTDTPEPDNDTPDEDIVPEPELVYSKVVCTGQRDCSDGRGNMIICPKEGDALYGQDANYTVRGACVPQSFEKLQADPEADLKFPPVKDNNTNLTWLVTGKTAPWIEENPEMVSASEYCGTIEYDGGGWRLPTPKELLTIAYSDINNNYFAMRAAYFPSTDGYDGSGEFWSSDKAYYYESRTGRIVFIDDSEEYGRDVVCVKGEEFGKTNTFTSYNADNEEALFDSTTNLMWQRTSASGKTWRDALKYCEDLKYAGYTDWRLPNKNEFATLINYSKTGDAAKSDFPGMEKESFALSTTDLGYNDGSMARPWYVNMAYGSFDMVWVYEETPEEYEETFSVRCVRSDVDPAPAADVIPECDLKTGFTPCKDSSSNIIWSQRLVFDWNYSWQRAAQGCRNLDQNGGHKWRLPTIDELRTLVEYDPIKAGGSCAVSTGCIDMSSECDEQCAIDSDGDGFAFESKLLDYGILVSGTAAHYSDMYDASWTVRTDYGAIAPIDFNDSEGTTVVRCVYDESMPDPEIPYATEDVELGDLYWSSISSEPLYWSDAENYCQDLEEGGKSDWRVPDSGELYNLVANDDCDPEEPACMPFTDGYHSIFGDAATLWSSTTDSSYRMLYDFMTGKSVLSEDEYFMAYVRCVAR